MSKDSAKGIVSNFAYNVTYQVVRMILPLITIPYVSRVLGAENLGIYSYTYSVAVYFSMFAYLGFENYGNRLIARVKDDREALNRAFSGAYLFQIGSSILAIGLYIGYILLFCRNNAAIAWLQLLYISSELFNISWFYFGMEKFRKTATVNVVVRLLSFAAILLFVKKADDLPVYTCICAGSLLVSSLVLWVGLGRYVHFCRVSLKEVLHHGRGTIILFFPVLVYSVYSTMDKIMLGNMSSMVEVALYTNADKVVGVPYSVITALGVVMIPRMTNLISRGETEKTLEYLEVSMRFMLFLACGMCFGMIGVGKVFAPVFFGKEFIPSGPLIMIIAPMIVVRACANVVRTQYLLPMGRDKDYIVSIVIGLFINLIFNSLLIPPLKSAGAAIATLMTESFVALYQIFVCRKDIPVVRFTLSNWIYVVAGGIMCVPVYLYGMSHAATVKTLIVQILIGIIVYMMIGGWALYRKEGARIRSLLRRRRV